MLLLILLQQIRNFRHEGVRWVRISEQGGDREQHLRDGQCGGPLILQDVQANASIAGYVAVVYFRSEVATRRLEGVIGRKQDVEKKDAALIRRIFRPHDRRLPLEHVAALIARPG